MSGGRGVPPPPPPPPPVSVIRLASELCSSLDRDGLRTSPPPEPEPEPEPLALQGTVTRPVPAAEGQEGGSSLSGLQGSKVKVQKHFVLPVTTLAMSCSSPPSSNQNQEDE